MFKKREKRNKGKEPPDSTPTEKKECDAANPHKDASKIATSASGEPLLQLPSPSDVPPYDPMVGGKHFTSDSIYDFYVHHLWPAIRASIPILLGRMSHDVYHTIKVTSTRVLHFLLPWLASNNNHNNPLDWSTNVATRLANNMTSLWEQAMTTAMNSNNSTSIHDFMVRHFDTNQDGHISPSELMNMTESFVAKLIQQTRQPLPPSFWAWFSREWPLMDWKVGLFVWRSCGGLLLVISILTIIPGRLHSISGRILRWPILGLTYFLIGVELMVYVVIRIFIRIAELLIATPKHRHLRRQLRQAKSYSEWYAYAQKLDKSQRRDQWQTVGNNKDTSSYRYNWSLIRELMTDMKTARQTNDSLLALAVLQHCTRNNVGGIMSEESFSYTNTGEPKDVVKEFVQEVVTTLYWVTDAAVQLEKANPVPPPSKESAEAAAAGATAADVMAVVGAQQVYEEQLQHKVNKEKDKIWQSVVSWATHTFHDHSNNNSTDNSNHSGSGTSLSEGKDETKDEAKDETKEIKAENKNSPSSSQASNIMEDTILPTAASSSDPIVAAAAAVMDQAPQNFPTFHREMVLTLLKRARAAYGRTALCLSGGAMMGNYHWGHVRALLEEGILPHIISGTSAGSVVGAILCTRTDDELRRDLNPEVLAPKLTCFSRPWVERIKCVAKHGHMFDINEWFDLIKWFTCGDLTFEEAYQKTGRVFCITLSTTTKKSPPVLLNYISAPNVTVASAVVASAAVPGFVPPVSLHYKDANGVVRSRGKNLETYFDGSIEQDIPVSGLAEMLNVQFFIACQCNPHVVPLFYNSKGGVGRPTRWSRGQQEYSWRGGFLLAALEMYLKNDMKAKFVFLNDLEAAVGFTSTLMTQEFGGSTTIVPDVSFFDYFKLFTNPTLKDLERYFQVGTVAAYPHCAMIKLHYSVADALDECLSKLEHRSKSRPRIKGLTPTVSALVTSLNHDGLRPPGSFDNHSDPTTTTTTTKVETEPQSSQTSISEEDDYEGNWIYDISLRSSLP